MVRLVFRPYTQLRRSICTSEPLRTSTRVSPGFVLARHSSPSFGSQPPCSRCRPTRPEARPLLRTATAVSSAPQAQGWSPSLRRERGTPGGRHGGQVAGATPPPQERPGAANLLSVSYVEQARCSIPRPPSGAAAVPSLDSRGEVRQGPPTPAGRGRAPSARDAEAAAHQPPTEAGRFRRHARAHGPSSGSSERRTRAREHCGQSVRHRQRPPACASPLFLHHDPTGGSGGSSGGAIVNEPRGVKDLGRYLHTGRGGNNEEPRPRTPYRACDRQVSSRQRRGGPTAREGLAPGTGRGLECPTPCGKPTDPEPRERGGRPSAFPGDRSRAGPPTGGDPSSTPR